MLLEVFGMNSNGIVGCRVYCYLHPTKFSDCAERSTRIFARVEAINWCEYSHIVAHTHSRLPMLHAKLIWVKELLMIFRIYKLYSIKISMKYFHRMKLTRILWRTHTHCMQSNQVEFYKSPFCPLCVFLTLAIFSILLSHSRGEMKTELNEIYVNRKHY